MNNELGRKITSLTLMTIMVAGGFAFSNPYGVQEAQADHNPHLFVSAENAKFENHMVGAQVVEVVVLDPQRSETDEGQGEPDVDVNGKQLRMVQSTDGNWYGYFADRQRAQIADQTIEDNDNAPAGSGLDFGTFCDNTSRLGNVTFTETVGVAFGTIPAGSQAGQGLQGTGTINDQCLLDDSSDFSNNGTINVVREPKTPTPASNLPGSVSTGQIGISNAATQQGDGAWPFIQLYNLNPTGSVNIVYNAGGGDQRVDLTFDTVEDFIEEKVDREKYPRRAHVHLSLTDWTLNIDPTDEDSWTFGTEDGTMFYQVFNENGERGSGITDDDEITNMAGKLDSLMFEEGPLTINPNVQGVANNVLTIVDNDDSITNGTTTTNIDNVALDLDDDDTFTIPGAMGNQPVTLTESQGNSGVFLSSDENDESVLRITPDAARGTSAEWEWDDTNSIVVGFAFANINMDEDSVGAEWNAGEEMEVILTDADANLNTQADEDLDLFNPDNELLPALRTGNPFVLDLSQDSFHFLVNATISNRTSGIANDFGRPVSDTAQINATEPEEVRTFSAIGIFQNATNPGISLDSSGDSSGNSNTTSAFVIGTNRTIGDLRDVVRNSTTTEANPRDGAFGDDAGDGPFRGFSVFNWDIRSFEENKDEDANGSIESVDIFLVIRNSTTTNEFNLTALHNNFATDYCAVALAQDAGLKGNTVLNQTVIRSVWGVNDTANIDRTCTSTGTPGNIDEDREFGIVFMLDDEDTGFLELGTAEHAFAADFMSFGFTNDGIPEENRVADQIVRAELEETGDNTSEFEGEIEYLMANSLNILNEATYDDKEFIDDDVELVLMDDETDEDAPRFNYNDRGADGVVTPVSDQEDAPTHSGVVELNADNYKIADTVEVTVTDVDLNLDVETVDIFTTVDPVDDREESDAVGEPNSFEFTDGTFMGRMLDITFDDERWVESQTTFNGNSCTNTASGNDGLASTGFTLVETGADTGVFSGDFQIPSDYCSRTNGEIRSSTGTDLEVNYVDFRDASGEIIEVGDGAGVRANTGSVSFDRTVYPIPWGNPTTDFENSDASPSETPDGRSVFPIHQTGVNEDDDNELQSQEFLADGEVKMHVRINDPDFDVNPQGEDQIAQNVAGEDFGPVRFSISRAGASSVTLATAGGNETRPGVITEGTDPVGGQTRELGPINEIAPDAGIYEVDLNVAYSDGPRSTSCPTTQTGNIQAPQAQGFNGTRFGENIRGNTNQPTGGIQNCILQGDIINVEYTDPADASGNVNTVTDSASFDLRNGVLQSDKSVYIIGSDAIITLIDPDLDLDNDVAETYTLDLIEWDSDADTLTMGSVGGQASDFDPEPFNLRETGDSTGIFQSVIEFPQALGGEQIERGEEVELEYEDWGPSGADFVGEEEEDIELTIWSSNFGATVELDQKVYTWTDKVFITVVAPDHNFDSNLIDEIGESDDDEVKVSTRGDSLDNYRLAETGTDTGIFTGEVILTGFAFDADGDPQTGDDQGRDTTPRTTGNGPTNGFLEADDDDGITVNFEFTEDETVVGSALVRWNIGEVQWLEESYPATGQGVVRVIDPDMNLNPESIDNFEVDVWSDSDSGGVDLTVDETNEATGIFEGTVFFTVEDQSSGHRLRVSQGDTVTAEYEDNTLPNPYTTADELEITATTFMGTIVPPLERAPATNPRIVDAFGNELDQVNVDQQVQISADLTNGQDQDQPFAYLVQIQDQNGVTIELAWITGTLSPGQTLNPSLSWTPDSAGQYNVQIFAWESVDDPSPLSEPLEFTVDVV